MFWTEDNIPPLINQAVFNLSRSLASKANVLRYELLLRFGGVYIDADFQCKRNLERLIGHVACFAGRQRDGVVNNAIIGAVPDHPFVRDLVRSLPEHARRTPDSVPSVTQSGPYYFSRIAGRHPELTVFDAGLLYPYEWHERWRRHEPFPDAYAVHHWTLSARDTERPAPRVAGDGRVPCLEVILRAPSDGGARALEWALEGLCHQTVSDFAVTVITPSSDAGMAALVSQFANRLDLCRAGTSTDGGDGYTSRAAAERLPCRRTSSDRVLFLDGDCVADPDVVESHADFGAAGVVPFGFRRFYPASKLYAFRRPLDYRALEIHSRPDPRRAIPFQPFYGDWRDAHPSIFSVPASALGLRAARDALRGDPSAARTLLQELWTRKYRLLPLLGDGAVTYVMASDEPYGFGGPVFRAQTAFGGFGSSYSSGGRPPIVIEVVSDPGNRHLADETSPAVQFVRFGLWDQAYDAAGSVRNCAAETDNFVGCDQHRLYFRVTDPCASGPTVSISWRSLNADGTDDDAPASQALTLSRTTPASSAFASRAVMLVTDDTDAVFPTDSGLLPPNPDSGLRGRGQSNHRTRRANIGGALRGEYRPAPVGPPVTVTVPVFQRNPDERRRVAIALINYGDYATAAYVNGQVAHANARWNQVGIRVDPGALTSRPIPPGVLDASGQYPGVANSVNEVAALTDLIPIAPDNTVTIVFIPMSGANAYATVAPRTQVALGDRYFVFVNTTLSLTDETLAHELHHVLFNRFDDPTAQAFFTFNTEPPTVYGIPLPDVRVYRRIQDLNSPDPDNDPDDDNILNWARRRRTARFPIGTPGLSPPTATTGNTLTSGF